MARELDIIVEMLRDLKRANSDSSDSFDKLLTNLSRKLDTIDRNTASADFIKSYLSELAKSTEDKYASTLSKITDIEKAIKAIFIEQGEHATNSNLQELLDIFSKNMNNIYSEAREQKAVLNNLENKISNLSTDKSDKEDILKTINLLHSDLENLNHDYKSILDDVNTELKNVLSNIIKFDQTTLNTQISSQLELVCRATNDIISYLDSMDKRDANLEKILLNVATNESLKLTKEVIDSIIEKTDNISVKINNLADKTDIEDLQKVSKALSYQLEETASKELFTHLSASTEALSLEVDNIKQTLAKVTTDIDNLPDTQTLEESLQKVFNKLKTLNKDIERANSKQEIIDLGNKLDTINLEFATIKNIVIDLNEVMNSKILASINEISFEQESYEIKNHISKMIALLPQKEDVEKLLENNELSSNLIQEIVKKTDIIADTLDKLPTHKDMDSLNNNQISLIENLQEVANKDDVEAILKQNEKIENDLSKLNFDSEFEHLYDKSSSIENWLINSNIKENTKEIVTQLPNKAEQKEILEVLHTLEKVAIEIEELSKNVDVKKVNRTIAEVYQLIEDLKNDFINTTEMHNDSIIVNLSELQKAITTVVTEEDFSSFANDLKDFVNKTLDDYENIHNKIEGLDTKIVSLSDYLDNLPSSNNVDILDKLKELKDILTKKNLEITEIETSNSGLPNSIENYLKEIQDIVNTNSSNGSLISEKIEYINASVQNMLSSNANAFAEVLENLNRVSLQQEQEPSTLLQNEMASTLSEVIELRERIIALANTFNELEFPAKTSESEISYFISNKLEELGLDMENLSDNIGSNFQTGFAYNAELLEEKANVISDLIKELRHDNTANIELYKKLTSADNKILDVIQELQLVNTDIITNIDTKNEVLLNELEPIKETIAKLAGNKITASNSSVKEDLEEIKTIIKDELLNMNEEVSQTTLDRLEETFDKISNQITDCENNLRDFILSDIDSVLIKIDSLKNEIEESINSFVPPEATQMKELNDFIKDINNFKNFLSTNFSDLAQDIKTSISEEIEEKHQELKSILSVVLNNNEILEAIEELKYSFKTGTIELDNSDFDELNTDEDFGTNDFEQEFEPDKTLEIINDLKDNFNHFSELIAELTDKNPEIENVLKLIQDKMQSLTLKKITSDETEEDIVEVGDKKLVGAGDFDFLTALNHLQTDIQTIHDDISNIIPTEEQIKLADELKELETSPKNADFEKLNSKIQELSDKLSQNTWLDEIKSYLSNDDIKTLLEELNKKVDILTLTDKSEWVEKIKNVLKDININEVQIGSESAQVQMMLSQINEKIDILATTDNSLLVDEIADLRASVDNIENKIDVIAASDTTFDIDEIKDSLFDINNTLNYSTTNINVTEILETINHKIDSITQNDDGSITQKLDDIKSLLIEQSNYINSLEDNNNKEVLQKCIDELNGEMNSIDEEPNIEQIKKTVREMKESIMSAIVTVIDQVSFIEETEEIKDFVEEKTDEINQNLLEVTNQLKQITNSNEEPDYTYSMQDIESDLAKLRMALNNIQNSENAVQTDKLTSILENINQVGNSVVELQNSLTKEEVLGLKNQFVQINDDILNLNDITKQLIIKSGESYSTLNTAFEDFSKLITDQLALKVDTMTNLLEKSNASDNVMRQALIYMGEWIDSASESMNKISTNSEEIIDIKSAIEGLKKSAPKQTEILNSIEEKFDEQQERLTFFEKQISKLSLIEERFEEQQERIDRLEMSLEKILSAVEDIDDSKVTRKIDKIDKQIAKLSTNIEKLTSYVD